MTATLPRILVFGAAGQVGGALGAEAAERGWPLTGLAHADLDIADAGGTADAVQRLQPTLVVNAAAHTAVDAAEDEVERAFQVNRDGAGNIARACARHGVPLVHLSTDYVFDGELGRPYREDDPTNPLSVYGRSKLAGEAAVRDAGGRALILRTSRVFGVRGRSFVRTVLTLAATRPELAMVDDQTGCPTAAAAIARTCLDLAPRLAGGGVESGTFHYAGPACSWRGFAEAVLAERAALGWPPVRVTGIPASTYPTRAQRPRDASLDCGRIGRVLGIAPPDWRSDLPGCVAALMKEIGHGH